MTLFLTCTYCPQTHVDSSFRYQAVSTQAYLTWIISCVKDVSRTSQSWRLPSGAALSQCPRDPNTAAQTERVVLGLKPKVNWPGWLAACNIWESRVRQILLASNEEYGVPFWRTWPGLHQHTWCLFTLLRQVLTRSQIRVLRSWGHRLSLESHRCVFAFGRRLNYYTPSAFKALCSLKG